MSITMSQLSAMSSEYNSYKSSLSDAERAFTNIIAQGTPLYSDPNMATQFPNTWAAYQAYLLSVKTYINNTIANFPVEPPLNG